jgi:hypothetical protein
VFAVIQIILIKKKGEEKRYIYITHKSQGPVFAVIRIIFGKELSIVTFCGKSIKALTLVFSFYLPQRRRDYNRQKILKSPLYSDFV